MIKNVGHYLADPSACSIISSQKNQDQIEMFSFKNMRKKAKFIATNILKSTI